MHDGVRTVSAPSIPEMRERFDADVAVLPAAAKRLRDATPVTVRPSERLAALTARARDEAVLRAGLPG